MKHVISALVQNEPGVLAHVAGMFAARGFNIDSLVVGRTEDPLLSRMVTVADAYDVMIARDSYRTPLTSSEAIEEMRRVAGKQLDPTLYAGVVKEKDGGIIVHGAQQLATAGVFSDYIYLSVIHPMQPG